VDWLLLFQEDKEDHWLLRLLTLSHQEYLKSQSIREGQTRKDEEA
jgi:hypothetical protein